MGTIQKLETTEQKVKHILESYPDFRDNDTDLIFYYWEFIDGIPFENWKKKRYNLTHAETIRRSRQKVQEDNPHLKGRAVKRRAEREAEMTQYYADKTRS